MISWKDVYMADLHRQQLLEEAEQVRLEKLGLESQAGCPNLFERALIKFANWMIARGKQLRKRYELPAVNCKNSPTGSLAS